MGNLFLVCEKDNLKLFMLNEADCVKILNIKVFARWIVYLISLDTI